MKNRGLLVGMSGFFAGAIASRCVDWATLPKAALAVGVALVVSTLALAATRGR